MSKAFTKDTDNDAGGDEPEEADALPAGAKNYMTRQGFKALQDELRQLMNVERPKVVEVVSWAAGNGDRSENGDYIYGKKRLREIDRRIHYLTKRLDSAEVVDPARQKGIEQVFFGATVTYARGKKEKHTVTLVGVDEADAKSGKISWISPIARALLKAREGDVIELRAPAGPYKVEVLTICYETPK